MTTLAQRRLARQQRREQREIARQQRRAALRNRVVIASHNINSNALKELSNELTERLGYKVWRVKPERINGRRSITFHPGVDKVRQFQSFHGQSVSAPKFANSLDDAKQLPSKQVVIRALTGASEGRGITIVPKEELTQHAPLYTEYIPKKKEFRVHVFNNKVIDVQEKRRKSGLENAEFKVRNTANGYVFCRANVAEPDDLRTVALAAVTAINRDQGAVDVIWNEKQNKCYVLEVNSRPGMQGTTLKIYADAVMEKLNGNEATRA